MARKTVPVEEEARDFTVYADKEPTGTMKAFADWLIDEVGLEFASKAAEAKFRDGVRLGGTLRMEFQASDFWKEHDLNPRSPQNQNGKAKSAAAKPARGKAASKPATEEDAEDEGAEDEAPSKPTRQRRGAAAKPAGKTQAKPTTRRTGRRGAAAAAATSGEAPY